MPVTVDVSQLYNFAGRVVRGIPLINKGAEREVDETATAVQAAAKAAAPVLTGTLQGSIEKKVDGLHAQVFTDLRYAQFVEYGTYKDPVQPFMAPAADGQERPFLARMGRVVISVAREAIG